MPSAGWGFSYMDHTGAYLMAIAILMAVFHRNQSGDGQWVDMSCSDGAATLNGPAMLDYTVNDRQLRRPGQPNSNRNNFPRMAPHGIYECAGDDQWVAISVRNDSEWPVLCEVMGMSNIERQYQNITARMEHQDAIDAEIERWTKSKTPNEVMNALQSRGIPAAAVQHPEDRMERDPNVEAWGLFPTVEHELIGEVRVDGMPMKHSVTPASIKNGAPILGQHNHQVFGDVLGMDDGALEALSKHGVI
jgi:crotonobetainyl-CoA:carnitine CoA-transferase CaiB-like acyl-CoA transferase